MRWDADWADQDSAWWAKANRAAEHIRALDRLVSTFRAAEPYTLLPEPADKPERFDYRLRYMTPVPVAIGVTVGDVLNNLRGALECLAFEIARRSQAAPLSPKQEKAATFPICNTPEAFEKFFKDNKERNTLFDERARTALRAVQPFAFLEMAITAGVPPPRTFEEESLFSDLHRLNVLWNIDKHRRLAVTALWLRLFYWFDSTGTSSRVAYRGDPEPKDGSILFSVEGTDERFGNDVIHEFDLVLTDDPAVAADRRAAEDVVKLMTRWHEHIVGTVFPTVFSLMSQPSASASSDTDLVG